MLLLESTEEMAVAHQNGRPPLYIFGNSNQPHRLGCQGCRFM
jgi:hypothetical protein